MEAAEAAEPTAQVRDKLALPDRRATMQHRAAPLKEKEWLEVLAVPSRHWEVLGRMPAAERVTTPVVVAAPLVAYDFAAPS
jgi:hypothetical protein